MIHAVLAQFTLMSGMQADLQVVFPHATELEEFTYTRGCVTDAYYAAAGWGEQPLRYWLDSAPGSVRAVRCRPGPVPLPRRTCPVPARPGRDARRQQHRRR
jgi:hypothetical protein